MNATAKEEAQEPQETNSSKLTTEGKLVNMVLVRHMKTYGNLDFRQILIDYGIRHCPPQSDGLLF